MKLNRVHAVRATVPLRNALISVADKSGIDNLVEQLWQLLPELQIFSTGGTFDRILAVAENLIAPIGSTRSARTLASRRCREVS
jgi:AICAR transformylase/IMP cyclohydrolase PurH